MKFENDTLRRRRTLGQKFVKKCKKQPLKGYKECLVDSKNFKIVNIIAFEADSVASVNCKFLKLHIYIIF